MSVDYKQLYDDLADKCAEQDILIASLRKTLHILRLKDASLPNSGFEWLANLQYKVKNLTARVAGFETGEKYRSMVDEFNAQLARKDREIRKLKAELADANTGIVTMRENWQQVYDDMEKAHAKEIAQKEREIKALIERALNAERQRDEAKDKLLAKTHELYGALTELEEEKGKNKKLKAQIDRDYENSSKPSSANPNRKKITNNREKSGKSPGGQFGHKHHPRKWHLPTYKIDIPAPPEYADSPNYKATGKIIKKQVVDIQLNIIVTEYSTPEFRNIHTGVRVSADFPGGLVDDVTYGGSVKSLAFLLNNHCNVSIEKVSEIISELSDGKLNLSTGLICGLSRKFSNLTAEEQKKAFADILLEPVMNVDFTTVRVNGENKNALVCATPENVIFFAKEHKGHEGVKDTPIEEYQHSMVHDHDLTFYSYGSNHQECTDHVLRYLKNSMENEPNLTWNSKMRKLIQEMIHFRKHLDPNDKRNPDEINSDKVNELELKYDELLEQAKKEYEYEPPNKYYMDGYNLYLRLKKYKRYHLLFLHDRRVPYSNSLSERLLRLLKRKSHQVMTFRSFGGFEKYCNSLGTIVSLRLQGKNFFTGVSAIFDRRPKSEINQPE